MTTEINRRSAERAKECRDIARAIERLAVAFECEVTAVIDAAKKELASRVVAESEE